MGIMNDSLTHSFIYSFLHQRFLTDLLFFHSLIHSIVHSSILQSIILPVHISQIESIFISVNSLIQQNCFEYLISAHIVSGTEDAKINQIHVFFSKPSLGPFFS